MVLNSDYLKPLNREPRAAKVGLTGIVPLPPGGKTIPVPTPRPDNPARDTVAVSASGITPSAYVPVPTPRPGTPFQ